MAQQGATLQNYNNELVKCIEDLREKREEVSLRLVLVSNSRLAPSANPNRRLPLPMFSPIAYVPLL